MLNKEQQNELRGNYLEAISSPVGENIQNLSMEAICNQFTKHPEWSIGPITRDEEMTFVKKSVWNDPTGIDWKCGFLFNPSLIAHDGKLFMFYRAAPKKESLCSRIGLAVYEEGKGWTDYDKNPVIYPTEPDELLGCEDPKIYKVGGKFIMFYHGVWRPERGEMERVSRETGFGIGFANNIKMAVSDDLFHWEKKGLVVPLSVSHLWAKAAVIPRNGNSEPVKINGEYVMYISEGCGGKQHVGCSEDMYNWSFKEQRFLNIGDMGSLWEVSCAVTDEGEDDLLLDFYYCKPDKTNGGAQALYSKKAPFDQREINTGGTLSWGGLIKWKGKWMYAQGWDANNNGEQSMYFYTAPVK